MTGPAPSGLFDLLDTSFDQARRTFGRLWPAPFGMGLASATLASGVFWAGGSVLREHLARTPDSAGSCSAMVLAVSVTAVGLIQAVAATLSGVVVGRLLGGEGSSPWRGFAEAWAYGPQGGALGVFLFGALFVLPLAAWAGSVFVTWHLGEAFGLSLSWVALAGLGLAVVSGVASVALAVRWSLAPFVLAVEGGSLRGALGRSARLVSGAVPTAGGLLIVGGALGALAYGIGFSFVDTIPFETVPPAELGPLIPVLVRAQVMGTFLAELPLAVVHVFMAVCGMQMYRGRVARVGPPQNPG